MFESMGHTLAGVPRFFGSGLALITHDNFLAIFRRWGVMRNRWQHSPDNHAMRVSCYLLGMLSIVISVTLSIVEILR